jgi:hypothetical protein
LEEICDLLSAHPSGKPHSNAAEGAVACLDNIEGLDAISIAIIEINAKQFEDTAKYLSKVDLLEVFAESFWPFESIMPFEAECRRWSKSITVPSSNCRCSVQEQSTIEA